jgi:hypothetical protein
LIARLGRAFVRRFVHGYTPAVFLSFLREHPMRESNCPSCENDISEVVTSAIVSQLTAGGTESVVVTCPHCGTELSLIVNIDARLSRLA